MTVKLELDYEVFLPKFRYLADSEADIIALWGGRDSGKTHFAAQKMVKDCLMLPYFKCILVRKVQDTIKESQFEAIKSVVNDWGLSQFFDFISHPLEIRCKNGNRFIAKGCDKIEKVKSVKDPTHVWFEELDQITKDDHAVISTTIRSTGNRTQEVWSFNPEYSGDIEDSWLHSVVDTRYEDFSEVRSIEVAGKEIPIKYEFNHSTYRDNKFCPPERVAKYLDVVEGDQYRHDVWINGWWGNKKVDRPFAFAFKESQHVSTEAVYREGLPVKISIDFNREPFTCILAHIWADTNGQHCHIFQEVEVSNGSIEEMAKRILAIVPNKYAIELTGDAMGNNRNVKIKDSDNSTMFTALRDALGIAEKQIRVVRNPYHSESRESYNLLLSKHPDFKMHPTNCNKLIRDHKIVEVDEHGTIKKKDRKQVAQQADFIDCSRYLQNTFLYKYVQALRR